MLYNIYFLFLKYVHISLSNVQVNQHNIQKTVANDLICNTKEKRMKQFFRLGVSWTWDRVNSGRTLVCFGRYYELI